MRTQKGGCRAVLRGAGRPRRRRPHHGDADLAARPRRGRPSGTGYPFCATRAGTNSARPAIPPTQQRDLIAAFDTLRARHASAEYRADEEAEIMARKNFAATGSFIAEDRPRALDLLGFSSQLVFNTFHNGRLHDLEHAGDPDLAYAAARAHNRGMLEFCSVDPRLLPSLYVPLADPERAVAATRDALDAGCRRPAGRLGLPARVLAQPHRLVRECGPRPRRRASPSCSTSAARAPSSIRATSSTASRSRPTSTGARRTSVPSTTWASPSPRPRRWPR